MYLFNYYFIIFLQRRKGSILFRTELKSPSFQTHSFALLSIPAPA